MISFRQSKKVFSLYKNRWGSKQPTRPTVLIQSDDWGRVGLPKIELLEDLQSAGVQAGQSPWDFYGAESAADLKQLGETLSQINDCDGQPACMTANIVMANADIPLMRAEGFSVFRSLSIANGFPDPWDDMRPVEEYKKLMDKGVFYPALHGFTHFSPTMMMKGWHDTSDFGRRARLLLKKDIPYLASLTPEYNFALQERWDGGERFATELEQREWVRQGVDLFIDSFGFVPRSTCAPGYRANEVTFKLWKEYGIKVIQNASYGVTYEDNGVLTIPRNVSFEPFLFDSAKKGIEKALIQARRAVRQGKMIVICSHSISYMNSHLNMRDRSLDALRELLLRLLLIYPDLRFANDGVVHEKWMNDDRLWFSPPEFITRVRRMNV